MSDSNLRGERLGVTFSQNSSLLIIVKNTQHVRRYIREQSTILNTLVVVDPTGGEARNKFFLIAYRFRKNGKQESIPVCAYWPLFWLGVGYGPGEGGYNPGGGVWYQEGTVGRHPRTDRHLRKHYYPATSLTGGKYREILDPPLPWYSRTVLWSVRLKPFVLP